METSSCKVFSNSTAACHNRGTNVSSGYAAAAHRPHPPGVTLIELLVVIAIMSLLAAMLLPVLEVAKERGRRIVCLNTVHQFIIGIQLYADNNEALLPSGLSESGEDEHTPVLSRATHDDLVSILGSYEALKCPWLGKPFDEPNGWYYNGYGYVIGYNYLGGHEGTPWLAVGMANAEWKSPKWATDSSSLPIVTELNAWTVGERRTFAPHSPSGALLVYGEFGQGGNPSEEIGAAGGNVGRLDGSAAWKNITDMKIYVGSRMHPLDGCVTAW
jgi:prepilin-type N-terminal cleavage/methylation domain-containing protein